MRGLWLKRIWCFWPGLLGLMSIFAALAWFLNPRPNALFRIATQTNGGLSRAVISPDGHFLAIHRSGPSPFIQGEIDPSTLQILDLRTRQEVFQINHNEGQFGFDPQDNLIWVESQAGETPTYRTRTRLKRWNPNTLKEELGYEFAEPADDQPEFTELRSNLYRFGGSKESNLLSPDCLTWLIPNNRDHKLTYELIDVNAGKLRGRLALAEITPESSIINLLEADFSIDGKMLLVQTRAVQGDEVVFRLHRFDGLTGRTLQSYVLLGREQPGSHQSVASRDGALGRFNNELVLQDVTPLQHLWYFSPDRVLGGRYCQSDPNPSRPVITFINSTEDKVDEMELDEIKGAEASWPIKDDKAHLSSTSALNYGIDPGSGSFIAFCQYLMEPDVSAQGGPSTSRCAPTQKLSVRNLQDGKLRNSFILVRADQDSDGYCGAADEFLAVLPGPRLLLKRYVSPSSDKLAQWVDQVREWLGRPASNSSRLVLVNGMTGAYDANFSIEPEVEQVLFCPTKSELLLLNQNGNGVLIRAFEYPLHKPWLLILSWSLGVALAITLLVEATRWWKRRRATVVSIAQ